MSLRYLIAAFAARVGNPSRKLVLLKLADNANDDGICWPSAARVAHDTELSRDTVKRHLKGLESDRIIDVRRRVKDGVNLPSVYELIGLHAAAQGWGHHAPTRGNQHPGVDAESTKGRGIMHPEPFTESINEAAARAPARTAADAAADQGKHDQGRRRRGDEVVHHGIEIWTPADAEGLQALINRHGAERVKEVAGGLMPAAGHSAPYLSVVVAAFQALVSAEAQAAAEVIRQARLAAPPSIDPETRERGAQVLATIRGRRQRHSTECKEVST